jgi:CNT family concentrative nucleoside transporter
VNVLYYLGILQVLISGISCLMHRTLGTSATESSAVIGSIFLGQTEATLIVGQYLNDMTLSEINSVMTSGFATISGSVLMLYITYGIKSKNLIAASVMSAPAAIAVSKIICPKLEESDSEQKGVEDENKASSLLDAIVNGALKTIKIVTNICVLLIAFIGAIRFADSCIGYLGERVGFVEDDKLSFTKLCGWILYPISWLMGAPGKDCFYIGELLGHKIFTNELVAYKEMICMYQDERIGDRSVYIATYALCGFSSFGAIGTQIASLLPLAPNRKDDIIRLGFKAMIAGNITCFITACVAGIFMYQEPIQDSFNLECSG